MCWGSFHKVGEPTEPIAMGQANLAVARCLVKSNADSRDIPAARGTIFKYGVDGVCHQLANQVLFSTGTAKTKPLTVKKARWYRVSSFLYGMYGRRQKVAWQQKIEHCAQQIISGAPHEFSDAARSKIIATGKNMEFDDFEEHAQDVLSDEPILLAKLLELRSEVQAYIARDIPGFESPSAEMLNAQNQHMMDQAALLLGDEKFEQVFGIKVGERIALVDPDILNKRAQSVQN